MSNMPSRRLIQQFQRHNYRFRSKHCTKGSTCQNFLTKNQKFQHLCIYYHPFKNICDKPHCKGDSTCLFQHPQKFIGKAPQLKSKMSRTQVNKLQNIPQKVQIKRQEPSSIRTSTLTRQVERVQLPQLFIQNNQPYKYQIQFDKSQMIAQLSTYISFFAQLDKYLINSQISGQFEKISYSINQIKAAVRINNLSTSSKDQEEQKLQVLSSQSQKPDLKSSQNQERKISVDIKNTAQVRPNTPSVRSQPNENLSNNTQAKRNLPLSLQKVEVAHIQNEEESPLFPHQDFSKENNRFTSMSFQQSVRRKQKQLFPCFLNFLSNRRKNLEFKFKVVNNKLTLNQKFYPSQNSSSRYTPFIYSVDVMDEVDFEALSQNIATNSYLMKKDNKVEPKIQLSNSQDIFQPMKQSHDAIKQFFQHLLEYIKKEFKILQSENYSNPKSLKYLQRYYDDQKLKTLEHSSNQRWPIYVEPLKYTCMRFFTRILQLFYKNSAFIIHDLKFGYYRNRSQQMNKQYIENFLRDRLDQLNKAYYSRNEENGLSLIEHRARYFDEIKAQVAKPSISKMLIQANLLIDDLIISENPDFLTKLALRQHIEEEINKKAFSDYSESKQIGNKVVRIKTIWKCEIRHKKGTQVNENLQRQIFKYLDSNIQGQIIQFRSKFVQFKRKKIKQKTFISIIQGTKIIIESPTTQDFTQNVNNIVKKFSQDLELITKRFYYVKARYNKTINLEKFSTHPFFKDKILDFNGQSKYFVYCKKRFGFYGEQSRNAFKIKIHRDGLFEFLNSKKQECQTYFQYFKKLLQQSRVVQQREIKLATKNQFYLNCVNPKSFIKVFEDELTQIQENESGTMPNNQLIRLPSRINTQKMEELEDFDIKQNKDFKIQYLKQHLSVMTWNLMKIFEKDKKGVQHRKIDPQQRFISIIKDIRRYKPDILCIQEASDIFYELKSRLCQQGYLYYMGPLGESLYNQKVKQTLILTRFPTKFFTVRIGKTITACCQMELEAYERPQQDEIYYETQLQRMKSEEEKIKQNSKKQKIKNETNGQKQQNEAFQKKKLSVLIMSIHLKCTDISSDDNEESDQKFWYSIQTRQQQLNDLKKFYEINIKSDQHPQGYDIMMFAGDWNIGDEQIFYGDTIIDHNTVFLSDYFDIQRSLCPETLKYYKTFWYRCIKEKSWFKFGGDRLDRILIKTAKDIDPKKVFKGVSEFSLVGDYSLVKGHNVDDNNDSLVCSPSDHFGVYAELIVEI